MPVTELVINRPNWLHNEGAGKSYLLRERDRKMCCLGFYALACGVSYGLLFDKATPDDLDKRPDEMSWLGGADGDELMNLNDGYDRRHDRNLSDSVIEAGIIERFAAHGIKVIFTDEPLETPPCR